MNQALPSPEIKTAARDKFRQMELLISLLLRAGVALSLSLVLGGIILSFVHNPHYLSSPSELARLIGPEADFPHTVPAVVRGMLHLQGRAFVAAGLLVLIATPVMRVAVSVVAFVHQRDRSYAIITSVVLALLLFSFLVGKAGR